MKYIRTKDGRILKVFKEDVSLYQENDGVAYYGKETIDFETSYYFPKNHILNQADTIEELCDEFVVEKKEPFIGKLEDLPRLAEILKIHNKNSKNKWNLYGAIWTDKGLTYVAKMNEKGELELL